VPEVGCFQYVGNKYDTHAPLKPIRQPSAYATKKIVGLPTSKYGVTSKSSIDLTDEESEEEVDEKLSRRVAPRVNGTSAQVSLSLLLLVKWNELIFIVAGEASPSIFWQTTKA